MAATEACTAPVQEDGVTETKSAAAETAPAPETANNEVVNKETVGNEVVNKDEAASTETEASPAAAPAGEAQAAEETPAAGTDTPAESKAKPAHDGIWDSFLNKSGLGKVMGGKKKKEASAEDAGGEAPEKEKNGEEAPAEGAEGGVAATAEDPAIEKAPEGEEAEGKKEAKEAKPKQSEKSSVRDLIRKPVARIFSHKSTEKKDGAAAAAAGEPQKQVTVRSKSLDRLEDPEALSAAAAEQGEEAPAGDGDAPKPSSSSGSSSTKHMKRWHSFKKLMAQRSHKKSSDDPKDTEVAEGGAEAGAGDSSTLDSKGENSGQKRWKLKRSWTFQGLKRDPSVVGISKAAKGSDKEAADAKGEEGTAAAAEEGEQPAGAAVDSEEGKAAEATDGAEAEKTEAGEEDKGAAAALGTVSQHANEIWTSFKKRVTPKSKKPAAESGGGAEEDGAAAAATQSDPEQTEEQPAGGKEAKSAKAKRTHFNRAVSLKNFILRKGKSTSVDGAPKEGEEEAATADGEAETPAGEADAPPAAAAAAPAEGDNQAEAPVANDHAAAPEGAEAEKKPAAEAAAPTPESSAAAEPAAAAVTTPTPEPTATAATPEVTTNGENGCTNGTPEEDAAHNHQSSSPKKDEANSTAAADAKITKAAQGNAVAQSEKKAGNV